MNLQNLIKELNNNILSLKNINNFCKHKQIIEVNNKSNKNNINIKNNNNNNIYKINHKDTLFWCFYILKNSFSKYEMINIENNIFTIEKEEKYKYISILRNYKDLLKQYKIKPLYVLEDELANKDFISIKTFLALCIIENINIFIVNNRSYFELIINNDINTNFIIHKENDNNKYYIEFYDKNKVEFLKKNYLSINNFDNKLKSISSYKLDDLIDIAKRLNIDLNKNNKKLTKKEIYEMLIINFR
jgi:hypothetical protein